MKNLNVILPFGYILWTLVTYPAYANSDNSAHQVPKFTAIHVTAIAHPPRAALATTILYPKKSAQPVVDAADYLQTIPGFNAIQSGGSNGDVTFRGMFGSRIKILVDGMEKLGACPNRMDAPTAYITPQSYDKVLLIKGPQTVRYPLGSAATVNFERVRPLFNDNNVQGEVSTVFGSFGQLAQNLQTAVGDAQFYAQLNGSRSSSGNYRDGHGLDVPSAWYKWDTDLALGWTPSNTTLLEIHGGTSDGNALYGGRSMDGVHFRRDSLGIKAMQQLDAPILKRLNAQLDYQNNDHVMDNFSLRTFQPSAMMRMPMAIDIARRTLNARLTADYQLDRVQGTVGIDSQRSHHSGRMGMYNDYLNQAYQPDAHYRNYGVFNELTFPFNASLKAIIGTRFDDSLIHDLRPASTLNQWNTERHQRAIGGFTRVEKNTAHHDWFIGLGHVERLPDYWELFTPVQGNAGSPNSFNGLNPEKTTQLDVAYRIRQGATHAHIAAYYGKINDFILMRYPLRSTSMEMSRPSAQNVDASIAGAEMEIGYRFNSSLQLLGDLAYAWGENTTTHTPLPQIAPLEGHLSLQYAAEDYNLGAVLRMVAAQPRIALNQGNIVGYDMNKSAGFTTVSLTGSYQLSPQLTSSVGIDNLFNTTYSEHLNKAGSGNFGYAAEQPLNNMGRNYWLRLNLKF